MVTTTVEIGPSLDNLTAREREILDQLLMHKSLKQIAFDLGVTPSAIDQRLKSARTKLGAADRNEAARIYAALLFSADQAPPNATLTFSDHVPEDIDQPRSAVVLTEIEPQNNIATNDDQARYAAEILDERFGRAWRLIAIPIISMIFAMMILTIIAIARALSA